MTRADIEAVIRDTLSMYSYHVSDECVSAMADAIYNEVGE